MHILQITIYGRTHSVQKIIHQYVTTDEYYHILKECCNPDRKDIFSINQSYNYEKDTFYLNIYTDCLEQTLNLINNKYIRRKK